MSSNIDIAKSVYKPMKKKTVQLLKIDCKKLLFH